MQNEAGAVDALLHGIARAAAELEAAEIIVVDDASTDDTAARVAALDAEIPGLRLLQHARSGGQSAAIHSGVRAAQAGIVCMLDGDGQNPPEELPKLWAPLFADTDGQLGLVAGQRVGRRDTLSKRLASRLANGIRRFVLKDGTRDTGCGLKGFRRDAFLALPYFDHMHRYLPALFAREGWEIELVDVSHRERESGRSKYSNLQRGMVGVLDLMGVAWLIRRRRRSGAASEVPLAEAEQGARPAQQRESA